MLNKYEKTFNELKDINSNYLEEDMEYKKSLKKKIKGATDLIKIKLGEKHSNYNTSVLSRDIETGKKKI